MCPHLLFYIEVIPSSVTLHQHHHNSLCPLSLSTSFYVFLYPSLLHSPPLPHTYAPTLGMPQSVEVLIRGVGVPGLLRAQPKRILSVAKRRSHHENVMLFWRHVGRGFPTARGHLPVAVKTGMLLLYEDSGMMIMKAIWWCIWGMWSFKSEILCV